MLRPVSDPSALEGAVRRATEVLDGSHDLSERWLQAGGRVAVPEESGLHLDAEQAARLAVALQRAGVGEVEAVAAEPLERGPTAYELDATAADLTALSHEGAGHGVRRRALRVRAAAAAGRPASLRPALSRSTSRTSAQ